MVVIVKVTIVVVAMVVVVMVMVMILIVIFMMGRTAVNSDEDINDVGHDCNNTYDSV